jgi:outer membrane protein assembly factor BamB
MPKKSSTRQGHMEGEKSDLPGHSETMVFPATEKWDPVKKLKLRAVDNPLPRGTLGAIGVSSEVSSPQGFPLTILIQPFNPKAATGVDLLSVRMFRWVDSLQTLRPVWNSGINVQNGFTWAKISQPGTYVPLGLPLDPVFREVIQTMARLRAYADTDSVEDMRAITQSALELLLRLQEEELEGLRRSLLLMEVEGGTRHYARHEIRYGHGVHPREFVLPYDLTLRAFKKHLEALAIPSSGLPEEALFFRPELQNNLSLSPPRFGDPEPWPEPLPPFPRPIPWPEPFPPFPRPFPWPLPIPWPWLCHLTHRNWWMYHHDAQHTGHASGCSGITSTTVGSMSLYRTTPLPSGGSVITIPSVVQGKIYVGTGDDTIGSSGGTLYKIDLSTGMIELSFPVPKRMPAYSQGIGGSPAVVDGKVYFSAIPGWVYCLDANTFAPLWVTDLRFPDPAHNQPAQNHSDPSYPADCWSSPLVVNGRVYIGCGEGEGDTFGFVYCLDANTGNVIWLFCTNQFVNGVENSPNVIPSSAVGMTPLLAGFATHGDPPRLGISVWSSCAYDASLNRIFVGTGNSHAADDKPLPDARYGSGVLALDATTGHFQGFFQPSASDCYRVTDTDVDVCGSPTVFTQGGVHKVAIGTKGGAYFILDANTLTQLAFRQLLPYDAVTGAPLPGFDTGPGENMWGVFGTAAIHYGLGRLFIGLGGYNGIGNYSTTPFMRAVDWNTLADGWTTAVQAVGANQVSRYTVPRPPMYTTAGEAALSSPAVVNDVVFVSTTKPGLYALDAATGLCLWPAPGITSGMYVLGPAIYGNYVIIGSGTNVYIYSL